MHIFKRFYLLGTTIAAFLIPLVIFTEYVEVTENLQSTILTIQETPIKTNIVKETTTNYLTEITETLYAIGVLIFGFIFFKNLSIIIQRIWKNPKYKSRNIIFVLLGQPTIPHTFFNYIFLNQQKFETKEIPDAVLLHEETHARQKHSIDLLMVELLQVVFWFNPLLIILKKSIKLNHEFLADQAVVNTGVPANMYQSLILAYSSHALSPKLANSLHYSSTRLTIFGKTFTLGPSVFGQVKKRISVMKTKTSKKGILIRSILLLPLTAVLLFGFSERTRIPLPQSTILVGRELQENEPTQQGASRQQLETYNALAKKYNGMINKGNIWIKQSEVDDMNTIYSLMTDVQKEEAEPFPDFPDPPPAPEAPKPPKNVSDTEYAANQIEHIIDTQDPYDHLGVNIMVPINSPTPPLSPNETGVLAYAKELAQQDAQFYYEDEKITIKKGIEIIASEKNIAVETYPWVNKQPEVKIYSKTSHLKKGFETNSTSPRTIKVGNSHIPPPPPEPKSPLDHVIEMAKQGAIFYYEDKEITSDKAIDIIRKNSKINIKTRGSKSEIPIVEISTE